MAENVGPASALMNRERYGIEAMIPATGTKMWPIACSPSRNSFPNPLSPSNSDARAPRAAQNITTEMTTMPTQPICHLEFFGVRSAEFGNIAVGHGSGVPASSVCSLRDSTWRDESTGRAVKAANELIEIHPPTCPESTAGMVAPASNPREQTAGKTGKPRRIPIGQKLGELIRQAIGDRQAGPIFLSPSGSAWSVQKLSRMYSRMRDQAGLPRDLVLYLARHECGTKICREKGIEYARRLLGHANISTTQRYMHLDERELAEAQDLVE